MLSLARPNLSQHNLVTLSVFILAATALSLGFACAMPFAAFATACAFSLPRRSAILTMATAWAANQLIGFTCLGYPFDSLTLLWGVILGAAGMAALLAAYCIRVAIKARIIGVALALLISFAAYESTLFIAALGLGGVEDYTLDVQLRVFAINAVALPILMLLAYTGRVITFASPLRSTFVRANTHA